MFLSRKILLDQLNFRKVHYIPTVYSNYDVNVVLISYKMGTPQGQRTYTYKIYTPIDVACIEENQDFVTFFN